MSLLVNCSPPSTLSLPPLLPVPQPAAVAADVIFWIGFCLCLLVGFLLLCLNKCKHDEGSFKRAQAEDLSCGMHGGEEE